ncbi:hypothetical protein K502DRAFT_227487 [Neoconidiobolus thromboides FSU 785]|nr:hypothetical protein K502DRAFT_227487 [Neoconidiobolus thromboides FSU 785]
MEQYVARVTKESNREKEKERYKLIIPEKLLDDIRNDGKTAKLNEANLEFMVDNIVYKIQRRRPVKNSNLFIHGNNEAAFYKPELPTYIVRQDLVVRNPNNNNKRTKHNNLSVTAHGISHNNQPIITHDTNQRSRLRREPSPSIEEELEDFRRKVIHSLALTPATIDTLVESIPIPRQRLKSILNEVARKQNNVWLLKDEYYRQVDVINWFNYSPSDRKMAATNCFSALGEQAIIPNSEYFKHLTCFLHGTGETQEALSTNRTMYNTNDETSINSRQIETNIPRNRPFSAHSPIYEPQASIINENININTELAVEESIMSVKDYIKNNKQTININNTNENGTRAKNVEVAPSPVNHSTPTLNKSFIDKEELKRDFDRLHFEHIELYKSIMQIKWQIQEELALLKYLPSFDEKNEFIYNNQKLNQINLDALFELIKEYKRKHQEIRALPLDLLKED